MLYPFISHVPLRHLRFPSNLLLSTLGVGVDISYRQNSFIAYRLSAFTQPFDTKIKLKGIQYKTEDSLATASVYCWTSSPLKMLSGYPLALIISSSDTDFSTSVDAINPIYEELINQTSGKATWERLAPYIGLGWEKGSTIRIVFRMACLAWALSVRKPHVSFQLPDVPIPKRYVGRIQAEEDNIKSKVRK